MSFLKRSSRAAALAALVACGITGTAQADNTHLLSGGIGFFDFSSNRDNAADFRLEYRSGWGLSLWPERVWLKPFLGIAATSDGSVFGGGGLLFDVFVTNRIFVAAGAGAFGYSQGGSELDLGHTLAFRTQGEIGWRFRNRSRLSLAVSHYSNAGIGDDNPGVEIISVYYQVPLDWLGLRAR